jgi:hypothetical protein
VVRIANSDLTPLTYSGYNLLNLTIVNLLTLKINTIINWEYTGFFTKEFKGIFFYCPGPSVVLGGEKNNKNKLLEIIYKNKKLGL